MSNLNVLVVGASIAGPMTAYWLAKAGARVTVIERFKHLRRGGQNIDIRTSGVTVMRKIPGMEEAVRARLTGEEGMCLVDDKGRAGPILRPTGNAEQQTFISEFEIFRGELSQIIYDLTKDNEKVKYIFGDQISSMQRKENGPVKVDFMNGQPSAEYDLVVGCDGATSRTRAMAFDCGVRDHIQPLGSWAAYWSDPNDYLEGSKVACGWNAVGGKFIGLGPDPSGINRIGAAVCAPMSRPDATLPFREASKQGTDALKQFVASEFRDAKWKVPEMMRGMLAADDFYASEMVKVVLPSYYNGRVVFVGDAGYASGFTGAGTLLAMTGAYVLAGEIAVHKSDLAAGLRAYEDRMKPLVARYKIPPVMPGAMAPQTAFGIWTRNKVFSLMARGSRLMAFITPSFGASVGKNEDDLPDYKFEA